ncbi:hypothetical protein CDD83_6011 [Cordyceps sp. RAO-2017]|nr:hypothetical protein CDD83_6011 [Cordyceps sp. RAO-2017]
MPSLLLWDDQGLLNFDIWTKASTYYPRRCEWEILAKHRHEIVSQFPSKSVVIELGCGNLSKTAYLLAAAEKEKRRIFYYALDVSEEALNMNLSVLKDQFVGSQFISISGLSGTYDDCADWLASSASLPTSTVTFLWLGNSVANLNKVDVSALLGQFRLACQEMSAECNFLISADSCAEEKRILEAYDPLEGPSRTFLFHGIHHANRLLGQNAFSEDEWDAVPNWNQEQHELRYSYAPKKDLQLDLGQLCIAIKEKEPIEFFMSAKWTESQVSSIADHAGLRVGHVWRDSNKEYCELTPE